MEKTTAQLPIKKRHTHNEHNYKTKPTQFTQVSPEDSKLLVYQNHEAEVKTYKDIVTRTVRNYRVTHVISPYHFYMEFDTERPLWNSKDWEEAMQIFYNDPAVSGPYKIMTSVILKFRCYAHWDAGTKRWHRIRVFKVDKAKGLVNVYFCDMGQFKVVSKDSLMELHPDFCTWSAQGFQTQLVDIQPPGGGYIWSKKAVDYFRQLVQGRVFRTIVMTRSEVTLLEGFPEKELHIGVVMIQREPAGASTLQGALVKAGLAEATGICAGYPEMFDLPDLTPYFSFEQFEKAEESELVCEEDDIQPNERRRSENWITQVMLATRKRVETLRADALKNENVVMDRSWQEVFYNHIPTTLYGEEHLPHFFQNRMGYIKFSHMISPSCGFVQIQSRIKELHEMELGISVVVEGQPHVPLSDTRAGTPIACLFRETDDRGAMWVRAVIKQSLPSVKLLKVILVDYGNECSVKYTYTRYLPPFFTSIPSFAHRVHMEAEGFYPAGGKRWGSNACDTFRKYVSSWEVEIPLYYAWRPPKSQVIHLRDFSQDIQYDTAKSKWFPAPPRNNPMNKVINDLKESCLLASLYSSTGVDVQYEILTKKAYVYQFQYLCDVLLQNGYAVQYIKRKTPTEIHTDIVANVTAAKAMEKQKTVNLGLTTHRHILMQDEDEDDDVEVPARGSIPPMKMVAEENSEEDDIF